MKCFDCGGKTKVITTRTADSAPGSNPSLISEGTQLVGWYTPEWVMRIRKCTSCGKTLNTIEMPVSELNDGWSPREE